MAFAQSQQMKKEFHLPMVPGLSCGEEMMRRNYHRSQIVSRGDCGTTFGPVPRDMTLNGAATGSTANVSPAADKAANGTKSRGEDLSGYVLRFYGYTMETVQESAVEKQRVRQAVFNYYLEDGTLSVSEPKQENSGISFASNLKRHIVPHPDGTPITVKDFRIGEPITFYGRTYMVCDADSFTREFLAGCGEELPAAITMPLDGYMTERNRPPPTNRGIPSIATLSPLNILLSPAQVRATQQFLAFDRQVLRCDCTWDDTASLHGYKHFLTLYYFLADGSIALVEKDTQNSGRDPFPNFFSRQKIAKPTDPDGRFDSSSLGSVTFAENKDTVYYSEEDIRIGNLLNLFGRKVLIHDYNRFTRDHLATNRGVTEYNPIPGAIPPPFVPPCSIRRELTTEELEAAKQLKDEEKRRHRFESSVVKFLMRLDNGKYEDEIRRFVLSVFPEDSTISIYEPVIRNSGIVGGKFLLRQKVKRPDGKIFAPDDFFMGASVSINCFPFVIIRSDERSLNYMECNSAEFSHSDINRVVRKIQAMLRSKKTGLAEAFREADMADVGLSLEAFLAMMDKLGLQLSEQEFLTVLRFFDKNNESYVSFEEVAARVLPEGSVVGGDERPWHDIYQESLLKETEAFVTDPNEAEEKSRNSATTEAASYAAKEFLELYDQRRQLFMKEFHAITDYTRDNLIGVDEFKMAIRMKLRINSISDVELNGLCDKLFTPDFPRVSYEELLRLFNGTSSLSHNMVQIAAKTSH